MFGDKEFGKHVGFPTPEETPIDSTCLTLKVPANAAWWGVYVGLLYELTQEENWQQFEGGMSVEDAAVEAKAIFEDAMELALTDVCGTKVPAPYWDEESGDDADDEAPADDQRWYGQWDGETFLETVSYVFLTAFLSTLVSTQAAIKFLTIPRTFRVMVRQNPHGAKLLLFLDGGLYGVINGYAPLDHVVEMIVASPGTEMLLVHSGEHDPAATPDANGNYTIDVIRMRLAADEVLPPTIRYDGDPPVYQTTNDGGVSWVDQPESDPRYSPTSHLTPLNNYSGIECDVAERMTQQLKATLDIFIATGDAAQFATGVIAIAVFPLGLVGWFLDLLIFVGNALIDIGQEIIEAAFTDDVYDDIRCTLFCFIDENGQISQASLDAAYNIIQADHAGVVATVIGELRFFYGDAAMSNAGVSRDDTGDCSGCPSCDWIVEYDFSTGAHGFQALVSGAGVPRGTLAGDHWIATTESGVKALLLYKAFVGLEITGFSALRQSFHGTGIGNLARSFDVTSMSTPSFVVKGSGALTNVDPAAWAVGVVTSPFTTAQGFAVDWNCDTNGTGNVSVYKLRISGTGAPPTDGVRVDSLT